MKRRLVRMLLVPSMVFPLLPVQAFAAGAGNSHEPNRLLAGGLYDPRYVRHSAGTPGRGESGSLCRAVRVFRCGAYRLLRPYVAWAAQYGVTLGTGGGAFSPGAYVDRQQMAVFFVRYFETFQVNYGSGAPVSTTPADLDSVSPWARDAVLKLWRQGIFVGEGGSFKPTGLATRAQAATLCYRTDEAVNTWYSEPGVPSDRVPVELPEPSSGGGGGAVRHPDYAPCAGGAGQPRRPR